MNGETRQIEKAINVALMIFLSSLTSGCWLFGKRPSESDAISSIQGPVGSSLGNKASGVDEARLAELYAVTTDVAPAAIRPDPDMFMRRLLRQYREEGVAVAQQIGSVEEYRDLVGGASEDFKTLPQDSYDATSLLAHQTVAEEICRGLVNPNSAEHPGWQSILPAAPSEQRQNLEFLAQRLMGLPTSRIPSDTLDRLEDLMGTGALTQASYVLPCVALSLDAQSLFF